MTTMFLIRHGLTAITGKTLYGQTRGISLDARGRRQADHLAERFAPVRVTAVYSSPLERSVETVTPLAADRGLDVILHDDLIEMDAGTWTNRPLGQLRRTRLWRDVLERPSAFRFPDGESFAEALARSLDAVHAIASAHPRGRVVVGTHGDIVRMLIAHLSGAHLDHFQRIASEPVSVSVVALGGPQPRVLLVNDVGGLERFAPISRTQRNLRG